MTGPILLWIAVLLSQLEVLNLDLNELMSLIPSELGDFHINGRVEGSVHLVRCTKHLQSLKAIGPILRACVRRGGGSLWRILSSWENPQDQKNEQRGTNAPVSLTRTIETWIEYCMKI